MSLMNPKEVFNNTVYSVQLLYIAGHSLKAMIISRSIKLLIKQEKNSKSIYNLEKILEPITNV